MNICDLCHNDVDDKDPLSFLEMRNLDVVHVKCAICDMARYSARSEYALYGTLTLNWLRSKNWIECKGIRIDVTHHEDRIERFMGWFVFWLIFRLLVYVVYIAPHLYVLLGTPKTATVIPGYVSLGMLYILWCILLQFIILYDLGKKSIYNAIISYVVTVTVGYIINILAVIIGASITQHSISVPIPALLSFLLLSFGAIAIAVLLWVTIIGIWFGVLHITYLTLIGNLQILDIFNPPVLVIGQKHRDILFYLFDFKSAAKERVELITEREPRESRHCID